MSAKPLSLLSAITLGLTFGTPALAASHLTSDYGDSLNAAAAAAVDGDVILVDSTVDCADISTRVVIVGSGGMVSCDGLVGVWFLSGSSGSVVSGLTVEGNELGANGIYSDASHDITILDSYVSGFTDTGIRGRNVDGWSVRRNVVSVDDDVAGTNEGGIVLNAGADGWRIEDNEIDAVGYGIQLFNAATDITPISDIAIRGNTISTGAGGAGIYARSRDVGGTQFDLRLVGNDLSGSETPVLFSGASVDVVLGSDDALHTLDSSDAVGEFFDVRIEHNTLGMEIETSGTCPSSTIDFTRLTPGHSFAVLMGPAGTGTVPGGPCVGAEVDLGAGMSLVGVFGVPASGDMSVSPALSAGACGKSLQAIDLTTCEVSTAAEL